MSFGERLRLWLYLLGADGDPVLGLLLRFRLIRWSSALFCWHWYSDGHSLSLF